MCDPSLTKPYIDDETLIEMHACCICCERFPIEKLYQCIICETIWDTCIPCGTFNPCILCENNTVSSARVDEYTIEIGKNTNDMED